LIDKIGAASPGQHNDLKAIKGIGPKLEKMLNELGIYTYEQVSRLTNKEYELIDQLLGSFQGRGRRDHWAEQAQELLAAAN
jgi:molybdopterin-containing oxidoreductase family membrane subunit